MRRIDFLGAHSVGKSTIYSELLDRRGGNAEWLTRVEAKRKVATSRFVESGSPAQWVKAVTCHLPRLGDVFTDMYTRRPGERAFAEADGTYHEFFEHCLRHLADSSPGAVQQVTGEDETHPPARRHLLRAPDFGASSDDARSHRRLEPIECMNLSWLFDRLQELCLLERLDETVVFDESLAHSTAGLLAGMPSDRAVRSHFEKMPAPDRVVHLTAPADEVARRIRDCSVRQAPSLRHQGLDTDELHRSSRRALHIAELGASTLGWRGVEVLSLDTTDPPEQVASQISEFVVGHS